MRQQELHLVCQYPFSLQIDIFSMRRGKGYRQQLHTRLLRCSTGFVIIAPFTGRYDVVPGVAAIKADWGNMIPGQELVLKPVSTVEAYMGISFEQGRIIQWRRISFARLEQGLGVPASCDD